MVGRAGLLARLRRLERPNSSRSALQRELADLEHRYPYPTREEIPTMSDEEMDDFFRKASAEAGPWARIHEIKELLRTPAERAELEREVARVSALTMDELEAELNAMLTLESA